MVVDDVKPGNPVDRMIEVFADIPMGKRELAVVLEAAADKKDVGAAAEVVF